MKQYKVRVEVLLEPIETSTVKISCGGETRIIRLFNDAIWTKFEFDQSAGSAQLTVEMFDKMANDYTTAVIVKQIKLNDIENIQNTYQGIYYPHNMESKRDTYIAWNGVWVLDFTVPVYTWMHKIQGLGWIYD
jgi:hypothetical protein